MTVVTLDADDEAAVLESDWSPNGKVSPWHLVCSAPCTLPVRADARFRVTGPALYASRPFMLPAGRDRVHVKAHMASQSIVAGAALLAAGYALLSVAGPTLVIAGLDRHHGGSPLVVSGIAVSATGAVVGTLGLISMVFRVQHKESRVELTRAMPPSLPLPGGVALEARGLVF